MKMIIALSMLSLVGSAFASRTPESYCESEDNKTSISVYNDAADGSRDLVVRENYSIIYSGKASVDYHRYGMLYTTEGLDLFIGGEPTDSEYKGQVNSKSLDLIKDASVTCRIRINQ